MSPRTRIEITGVVQGVGFRPFVYNLAHRHQLAGYCQNTSEGVLIEVEGEAVERFIQELKTQAPPLARIDTLHTQLISAVENWTDFNIRESLPQEGRFALISPDIATCPDCMRELFDPADRRYRYPFINCTNCGPRYSIVRDIPYDRPKTTMAPFAMCPACEAEYHDPANRRFHAQPNACHDCGPKLELIIVSEKNLFPSPLTGGGEGVGEILDHAEINLFTPTLTLPCQGGGGFYRKCRVNSTPVEAAIDLLRQGAIGAIKGLGGFHLACDATNQAAVARLREWKRRSNKPFALMAPDVEAVRRFCRVSEEEQQWLEGRTRPIVLLERRAPNPLADAVAPGQSTYGVMLPYTPLHALLLGSGAFTALVMTSGNLAEEPIVIDNEEAMKRLAVADFFLLHNRDIYMRVDDSIVRGEGLGVRGEYEAEARQAPPLPLTPHSSPLTAIIRRSRGFVPETIDLGEEMEEILACGAELKNTFCLTKGHYAIPSQHIGDLQNWEALTFFEETLANLKNTFRVTPKIIAHDLHPDYMSTRFAHEYAEKHDIPPDRIVVVQHHHAHIVSCMAEHNLRGPVVGVAFDGTGFGKDGQVWGGEFFVADRAGFERKAHLRYIPMPGGDGAAKEPWRMAAAWLILAMGEDAISQCPWFFDRFDPGTVRIVASMLKGGHAPLTSSAGRFFDAVSSLLGLRDINTFEGEAAMALETAALQAFDADLEPYPFRRITGKCLIVDPAPAFDAMVANIVDGVAVPVIAARFHRTLADIIVKMSRWMREESGISNVVLSGGVFQNRLLTGIVRDTLTREGFSVWTHEKVPCNDGGISLGQAVVAWERVARG